MKDSTITFYRRQAGISQEKLAKLLNMPRTTISFFETKRQYPDLKTAEKLADILQIPVGRLYADYELELILRKNENNNI